jgi:Trk K+ transport system NAD-binding subunit
LSSSKRRPCRAKFRLNHPDVSRRAGNRFQPSAGQAAGRSLRELKLGAEILISAVKRGDEYLVPRGDTRLEIGDWITVYGETELVDELKSKLE